MVTFPTGDEDDIGGFNLGALTVFGPGMSW